VHCFGGEGGGALNCTASAQPHSLGKEVVSWGCEWVVLVVIVSLGGGGWR